MARGEAKRLAAEGKPGPGSIEYVAREWLVTVHERKVSAGHADRTRIRFEQDVFPWLGARPISEVEAPELLTCLRRVIARAAIETAHRTKDACAQVFRFGVASGCCERNPAADLRDALAPVPTRHLAAIVEPQRAADLLRAMLDYKGHPATRSAPALSAQLFLRPGELRHLEWKWIDSDEAMLMIPSTPMKRSKAEKANGAPHAVPLATQAVSILRELHALTGHGFCAMARTMAAERLGIAPEVIEAQLAHSVADALGRACNRTQYLEQRRDLMQRWADHLDRLCDGAQIIELPFKMN